VMHGIVLCNWTGGAVGRRIAIHVPMH